MDARAVLVTGGTGALGRAVVERFLAEGARVVVPWVSEAEADELRNAVGEGVPLTLVHASVTDPEGAARTVAAASQAGRLEAAVLLVGGFVAAPLEETERDAWDRMVALNATSLFQMAHEVLPVLKANGGGRIVTVGAEPALNRGGKGVGAYAATKAAAVSLTQTLAREGGPHGITANAVVPRIIDTPANRASMPDADTSTWLRPTEIAEVIAFLAGPDAGIVNGSLLTLSRG